MSTTNDGVVAFIVQREGWRNLIIHNNHRIKPYVKMVDWWFLLWYGEQVLIAQHTFVGAKQRNTAWRWSETDDGKTVLQQSETHYSVLKLLIFEFPNRCNASQIAVMPVLAQGPTVCPSHRPLLECNGSNTTMNKKRGCVGTGMHWPSQYREDSLMNRNSISEWLLYVWSIMWKASQTSPSRSASNHLTELCKYWIQHASLHCNESIEWHSWLRALLLP
jgi:hypothetical protein